jgi:DNA polymerase V
LDLNALLLSHPQATYLVQVSGHSMTGGESGIRDGALLAVDCRLKPQPNDIIIAVVEGQYTVKRLVQRADSSWWLVPDNPSYPSLPLNGDPDLYDCWGVVTHVLTETRPGKLSRYVRVG